METSSGERTFVENGHLAFVLVVEGDLLVLGIQVFPADPEIMFVVYVLGDSSSSGDVVPVEGDELLFRLEVHQSELDIFSPVADNFVLEVQHFSKHLSSEQETHLRHVFIHVEVECAGRSDEEKRAQRKVQKAKA